MSFGDRLREFRKKKRVDTRRYGSKAICDEARILEL